MPSLHIVPVLLAFSQIEADEVSLEVMQHRAQQSRLSLPADSKAKIQLVTKPVFRYSDQLRGIEDATTWLWIDRGRPVAAMKIEHYRSADHARPWLYCFTSLSDGLMQAEWESAPAFRAQTPGVKWQPLKDKPAEGRAGRLLQMREIARRFSAELTRYVPNEERSQMRLLPRPLYRYEENPDELDGAVFGFTGTGTNPDLLLLVDLQGDSGWRFGLAGMTAEGVSVRLEDREIWQFAHTAGKGTVFDSWTYFRPTK